jgi:hypothetical protein
LRRLLLTVRGFNGVLFGLEWTERGIEVEHDRRAAIAVVDPLELGGNWLTVLQQTEGFLLRRPGESD